MNIVSEVAEARSPALTVFRIILPVCALMLDSLFLFYKKGGLVMILRLALKTQLSYRGPQGFPHGAGSPDKGAANWTFQGQSTGQPRSAAPTLR